MTYYSYDIAERLFGKMPDGTEIHLQSSPGPEEDDLMFTVVIPVRRRHITEEDADAVLMEIATLDYETEDGCA